MTCARCRKPLPDGAVKNDDPFCSRKCCELKHGLGMAADVTRGPTSATEVTRMRTLAPPAAAVTVLQREAAARDLEARARVARETRSGRHARFSP